DRRDRTLAELAAQHAIIETGPGQIALDRDAFGERDGVVAACNLFGDLLGLFGLLGFFGFLGLLRFRAWLAFSLLALRLAFVLLLSGPLRLAFRQAGTVERNPLGLHSPRLGLGCGKRNRHQGRHNGAEEPHTLASCSETKEA